MKEIAREMGYNLVVHGSLHRDLDLIAISWVDNPSPQLDLVNALSLFLTGKVAHEDHWEKVYYYSKQPGGRDSYIIQLHRGGYKRNRNGDIADPISFEKDPEYYVDLSFTPLVPTIQDRIKHNGDPLI